MTTRRSFIKQSGIFAAGVALSPNLFLPKNMPVGIQLYSVREVIGKDVKGALAKISAAGYGDVETYGGQFFGFEPKAFKELLTQNKLTTISGHTR